LCLLFAFPSFSGFFYYIIKLNFTFELATLIKKHESVTDLEENGIFI